MRKASILRRERKLILLTDEEIKNSFEIEQGLHELIVGRWVAKAQLKKVVDKLANELSLSPSALREFTASPIWQALLEETK